MFLFILAFFLFSEEFIVYACKERCLSGIQLNLSSEQRDSCEGSLSLTELSNALKSLNLNRSPGLDGLTVEFYLHFWDVLAPLLLRVANECFLDDRKCLKNWRPISLLNVDYKILPPVCQKFLVLLFIRIKLVPYLVVLFFLTSLSYEIPMIISSVRMRRQFL